MKLRLSGDAKADLRRAFVYIAKDRPRAAEIVVERIMAGLRVFAKNPRIGRPGRMPDTREWVIRRTGYVAIYTVSEDAVTVFRIIHGHQNWPPGEAAGEP